MVKTFLFVLCLLPKLLFSLPIENSSEKEVRTSFENPDLYQGDIMILGSTERFAHSSDYFLWPQRTIPYVIDSNRLSNSIRVAMNHIEEKTCIRFRKRTDEMHYVRIFPDKG
ncbi:uncharacterized protein B4U79_18034 [Dinothrombium tinctorium]|uniref:Peptidase M12A domain-containing protein n=1 Tax=Dinothrombium tinctorium TaxID=1965070 RepID=A0A3S3P9H0_9ACAR|nr:uncharacterized protein B4U79_18189 [Dinothrombium tinctorium]RWS08104.1 uncharacterized protein B4U79_18180 [Dinothrombium tinctorium]RWS11899.1 uncharacterized protein B4U79_18034 [Dinothrombium tinctorium]